MIALLIKLIETVEVELSLQIAALLLPLAQLVLENLLLADQSNTVNALVHTQGVLPVVGALSVLGVVHDTDGLGSTHVTDHDVLLDTTNLGTHGVLGITLQNAVAGEVTVGGARIAHRHSEVTILVALHGDGCPALRVVRHVLLAVLGRAVGHRVGIDAEDAEVAGLARPHPVIGLATELTHGLGNGKYQTHILEVAVGGEVVLVTLVERLDFDA